MEKKALRKTGVILLHMPWLALLGWLAAVAWFLCDDAFISFRYARNLLEGHGLVFNPGEYVEGYSNFLWVLELAAIWKGLGIAPEYAAPWLSVAFTAGTIAVMTWWIIRLPVLHQRTLVAWMAFGLVCSSATFAVTHFTTISGGCVAGLVRSISGRSSSPSTASTRGTVSMVARGSSSTSAVLPKAESPAGMAALLERIAASGQGSFLAVLKLFGPVGEGLMSFPMEGYTLALNFPLRGGTLALLDDLDEITHRHGGRVYLAKDACCRPERMREGYPRLGIFEAIRAEASGDMPRFESALARRIGL